MNTPKRIQLAYLPTPLQQLSFQNKKFVVKRDDLSGLEMSGNKVRKLEYILYQAKKMNSDVIFTCGGEQSNHARATAVACAKLGLTCRLFLWGSNKKSTEGNLFFDKLSGCKITFLDKAEYAKVNEIMFEERKKLLKHGKNVYVIPEGGSTTLGIWGYISFIEELGKQIPLQNFSGILTAAGSGGTAAGLLIGSSIMGLNLKIYAVNVLYSKLTIQNKVLRLAEACNLEYKLNASIDPANLVVLDGYSNEGYKEISMDKIKLIKNLFMQTGILLDPAYTGKAFNAYYDHFLGKRKEQVIFLHTGGLFGVFAKSKKYLSA
ncbi:MAG: pyridoxal-phosphate dependent enzyme [Ignavibacteriaceae bacterium]|nr:pyridoxal-phosphate dependent enzyme [Ignavibacteriaceae bacterium]